MNRTSVHILLGFLMLAVSATGQTLEEYILEGKDKIAQAVFSQWDQKEMLDARALFERLLTIGEKEWLLNYYIAFCDYRLTTYAFGEEDKDTAKRFVNDGIKHLNESVTDNPKFADAYALLSSMYGNKIALSPWLGFIYGPIYGSKSGQMMYRALALEPQNPRVHLIQGISYYYTPKRWGGGKDLAREAFTRAVELFANEKADAFLPDWGHSEAYGYLGLVELDLGDTSSAKLHFEKALEIDPANGWVKYKLMPKVENR